MTESQALEVVSARLSRIEEKLDGINEVHVQLTRVAEKVMANESRCIDYKERIDKDMDTLKSQLRDACTNQYSCPAPRWVGIHHYLFGLVFAALAGLALWVRELK